MDVSLAIYFVFSPRKNRLSINGVVYIEKTNGRAIIYKVSVFFLILVRIYCKIQIIIVLSVL